MSTSSNPKHQAPPPPLYPFSSRRSVVHSTKGIVASSQPLASQAGIRILEQGGNAADAAVAVAAALNVTEPCSTGIGGDMFCLFFDADANKVSALNGSGRSAGDLSLRGLRTELGLEEDGSDGVMPTLGVLGVTVPGAAAGWIDCVERFGSGKLSMEQILAPAIRLAEEGFPVSEITAYFWKRSEALLKRASPNGHEMLKPSADAKDGYKAPGSGEIMKMPNLANTFRLLARHGKKGFYEGEVAKALIKVVSDLGGHLSLEDLKSHADQGSEDVDPISLKFQGQGVNSEHGGLQIWEHPPNGQGIVALMALGIIEQLEKTGKINKWKREDHNSAQHLHACIEALRIAFADGNWWIADPNTAKVPTTTLLLSPSYLASRAAAIFDAHRAAPGYIDHGSPAHSHSDTVYFAVTDRAGNAASFINSNYSGFGTAIVPAHCGFTLQNRGANFSLHPDHPNAYAPRKRPYHTIIPALATNADDGSLSAVFGVMGGFMQPQGHVQVLLNHFVFGMSVQAALDAPRFCIGAGMPEDGHVMSREIHLEDGIRPEVADELAKMGHDVSFKSGHERSLFGRGQIIRCVVEDGQRVYSAGSDPRADGAALPAI